MTEDQARSKFVESNQQKLFQLQEEIKALEKKKASLEESNRQLLVKAEQIEFSLANEKKNNEDILRNAEEENREAVKIKEKNKKDEEWIGSLRIQLTDEQKEIEKAREDLNFKGSRLKEFEQNLQKSRDEFAEESKKFYEKSEQIERREAAIKKSEQSISERESALFIDENKCRLNAKDIEKLKSENEAVSEQLKKDRAVLEERDKKLSQDEINLQMAFGEKNRELNRREAVIRKREEVQEGKL